MSMEADWGSNQAVDKVSSRAVLRVHTDSPLAAVVIEAGADGQGDDALMGPRVAAAQPDWSVGTTGILRDAECGHGVPQRYMKRYHRSDWWWFMFLQGLFRL